MTEYVVFEYRELRVGVVFYLEENGKYYKFTKGKNGQATGVSGMRITISPLDHPVYLKEEDM